MTLRIRAASQPPRGDLEAPAPAPEPGDDWSTRIVKLIPAEALGLYGAALSYIQNIDETAGSKFTGTMIAAVACSVLIYLIRSQATGDSAAGKGPQLKAIAISIVSFALWLAALAGAGEGLSPFEGAPGIVYAPLLALFWGVAVPYVYKGD